jgi:hypothetical protein
MERQMTRFTADNYDADRATLETLNLAYDEAWSALKSWAQAHDALLTDDDVKNLSDAVHNHWVAGVTSQELAEAALRAVNRTPVRDVFSLECK